MRCPTIPALMQPLERKSMERPRHRLSDGPTRRARFANPDHRCRNGGVAVADVPFPMHTHKTRSPPSDMALLTSKCLNTSA